MATAVKVKSGSSIPHIAVVSPRGLVGEELLKILSKWRRPIRLSAISTQPRASSKVSFRGSAVPLLGYQEFLNKGEQVDILLCLSETDWSRNNLKKFFGPSEFIIDESAAFRLNDDVPLVVPEINGSLIENNPPKLMASPNCTTTVLAMALAPLARKAGLRRVVAASYQAASGAGRSALDGFLVESKSLAGGRPVRSGKFPHRLAGNVIPQIGPLNADGFSEEEEKVARETRKILSLADLPVSAFCVRVPVLRGHSLAVWAELEKPASNPESYFEGFLGLRWMKPYPTPVSVEGQTGVMIGRLRQDPVWPNGVSFWVAGDNLIKGAAQNVAQIAEIVLRTKKNKHET